MMCEVSEARGNILKNDNMKAHQIFGYLFSMTITVHSHYFQFKIILPNLRKIKEFWIGITLFNGLIFNIPVNNGAT